MADYIDAEGLTSTVYRSAFRAIRSLRIEILFVAVILGVQAFLRINPLDTSNAAVYLATVFVDFLTKFLLVPYAIAVYRSTLGLPLGNYLSRSREMKHNLQISFFAVVAFIIDLTMKISIVKITKHYLIVGVSVTLALFWVKMRLYVIAPALVLGNFQITARRALDATAGRICELIFIDICTAIPFVLTISMLGFAVFLAHLGLKGSSISLLLVESPVIPSTICAALLSTVGLSLRFTLEAEVFRRLFLASATEDKNENFLGLS